MSALTMVAETITELCIIVIGFHAISSRHHDRVDESVGHLLLLAGPGYLAVLAVEHGYSPWVPVPLMVLLAVISRRIFTRGRRAQGIDVSRTPGPRQGWRLWIRLAGAAVCIISAIGVSSGPVDAGTLACGSMSHALAKGAPIECVREASMHMAGTVAFAVGAAYLVASALRGGERKTQQTGAESGTS